MVRVRERERGRELSFRLCKAKRERERDRERERERAHAQKRGTSPRTLTKSVYSRARQPNWWAGLLTPAGKGDCPFSLPQSKAKRLRETLGVSANLWILDLLDVGGPADSALGLDPAFNKLVRSRVEPEVPLENFEAMCTMPVTIQSSSLG